MKLVTQAELARELKVSKPYISKLVKKGIFNNCFDGKKLKLDCGKKAYEENRKIFVRETKLEKVKKEVIKETPIEIKHDKELFNNQNLETLAELLLNVDNPALKVQIIKEYWVGKLNELKFLKEKNKLIEKDEVEREFYEVALMVKEKLLNIPMRISNELAGKSDEFEIRQILENEIRISLEDLSRKLKND
jgi:transcriptional regulator with XRE-family HTH domain